MTSRYDDRHSREFDPDIRHVDRNDLRRETELERLRESEAQLRAIVDTTPECVKVVAADGTVLHMNAAGLAMVGADDPAAVIGKSVYDLIAPEDRDRFREFNQRICAGQKGTLEFNLTGTRGVRRRMETHAAPLRNCDGNIVHLAVARDITDRTQAEEKLRRSEEELREFVEEATIALHWVGPDGTILWANQAELDLLGYSREEYIGRNIAQFHVDAPVLNDIMACLTRGERIVEREARLRAKSGDIRYVLIDSSGKFEDGKFVHTRCFTRDITARKEADSVRARLAAIVESSDDAIISKNLQGIITSWNPGAERMFGYSAEEMIGRPITTIIPPEMHDDERRIMAAITRGERIDHFETVRITKTGDIVEVSLTISPVKDKSGRIVGAAKIARDITQRKKAESALRTTERLASVGRLAATVAHEINNPLEALTNLVYLAKIQAVREDVRKYLEDAEAELERIAHLTKQTLGFYRETHGASIVKLSSLVTPLLSVFASRTRSKNIELEPEFRDDPEIVAVAGEMRQLVANLLSNSIDAIEESGRIRIRVSGAAQWNGNRRHGVRLTIADTGPGIPRAVRSKIFEPFFTTKKEIGTGLGLWVCKSIVDKHHGSIRIKSSTVPGKSWTVFSVFLPAAEQSHAFEKNLRQAV